MATWHHGFKDIKVKLIDFAGDDLARRVCLFGQHGEFYRGIDKYYPGHPLAVRIVDDIIAGKTFPKYAMEGHMVSFDIQGISRVCLAQITREQGFFCSESSGVMPSTMDLVVPLSIANNREWMDRLKAIQKDVEKLYCDMCEAGVPFPDTRYFTFHAQSISLCYTANWRQFANSCNSRTDNNFADEINYVYRLMFRELKRAIQRDVTDPLSKKLWAWLLKMCDKKGPYLRNALFNNDFTRFPVPDGYKFESPANNDMMKSNWRYELERIKAEEPDLLLDGEEQMIMEWQTGHNKTTYDPNGPDNPPNAVKRMPYYTGQS